MNIFEIPRADTARKKIEQVRKPEVRPEQETEKSRVRKIIDAFSETFRRLFQPEKYRTEMQEENLRRELVSRGFLRQEVALGMNTDELRREMGNIYEGKLDISYDAFDNREIEHPQKEEMKKYFYLDRPLREMEPPTNYMIGPSNILFNYDGNISENIKQWNNFRQWLDIKIPDERLLQWKQMIATRREEARIKEMRESWAEYQEEMEKRWPEEQQKFQERTEEKRRAVRAASEHAFVESWPMLKEVEEKEQEYIASLCKKETMTDEEQNRLKEWLYYHKEFGLQEMSDDEYDSFFCDGRFYAHFSYFFSEGQKERGPKFIEALKDGYLIPKIIGEERGEQITGDAHPERTVCFDNEKIFGVNDIQHGDHSSYAECSKQNNMPIALVCPASLLENHAFYKGTFTKGRDFEKKMGEGEGYHFGSENLDAKSRSHEIDISLFTMLVPDAERISYGLINSVVQNLERFIKSMESTEIKKLREMEKFAFDIVRKRNLEVFPTVAKDDYGPAEFERLAELDETAVNISMRNFMTNLFTALKKEGVNVPRLYFYEVKYDNPSKENWGRDTIKEGLREFNFKKCPTRPSTRDVVDDVDLLGLTGYMKIPERFWADRKRTEEVGNLVRKTLKKYNQVK
jgi:hypothetical protein